MDISNLKPYDWVLTASGAVMLIFGMALDWQKVDTAFGSASGGGPFDLFFTGGISWLLVSALGVLAFLVAGGVVKAMLNWNVIFVIVAALASVLMLIRIVLGGGEEAGIDLDRGPGMYVAFLAAIAALAGAVWKFTASGGSLQDLRNPDTIKGAFKQTEE